ncbi:MAG: hypothetical protein ACKPBU_16800 [Alphaproteobacteria bacterium]
MAHLIAFLSLVLLALAVGAALRAVWGAIDDRESARTASAARVVRDERAWKHYESISRTVVVEEDFREAGWTQERTRRFLDERFPGRREIPLAELRPFMDDVLVRDLLSYRRQRFDAAQRYEPIRHTWVSVDQLERDKALPHELRPLVTERERQSGRLILAGDLIPFVGRPVVRDLLEQRLAECGAKPLEH